MLLEFVKLGYTDAFQRARAWWFANLPEEEPMTLEEFDERFPEGSDGVNNLNFVAGHWETAGVLVRRGLMNEDLFFDRFLIAPYWNRAKRIIKGLQRKYDPLIGENFEWLARRASRWMGSRRAVRKRRRVARRARRRRA